MIVQSLQFVDDLRSSGATVFPGVPFMFHRFRALELDRLPSLRLLITAGGSFGDRPVGSQARPEAAFVLRQQRDGGISYDDTDQVDEPLHVGRPCGGDHQMQPRRDRNRAYLCRRHSRRRRMRATRPRCRGGLHGRQVRHERHQPHRRLRRLVMTGRIGVRQRRRAQSGPAESSASWSICPALSMPG